MVKISNSIKYILILLISQLLFSEAFAETYNLTVCSGSSFNYQKPGASNVNYTWTIALISPAGSIINATPQSSPQSSVSQLLTNTTSSPATISYSVTASDNTNFTLLVTVNPLPVLTKTQNTPAVCSQSIFKYTPSSNYPGTTSYIWYRAADPGTNNNSSAGTNLINETLVNNTLNPIPLTYVFSLTANGCVNVDSMSAIVYPLPTLDTVTSNLSVCSGAIFTYTPGSKFSNVSYSWIRYADTSINNSNNGSGVGIISEALTNASLLPVLARYVITLSYTPSNSTLTCTNPTPLNVIVNPILSISNQTVNGSCSGTSFMVSPSITPPNTMYTWTDSIVHGNVSGASAAPVPQFFVGQNLINNGSDTAIVQYSVTPSTNGCPGSNFLVTVNVIPLNSGITLSSSLNPPAICSGTTFNYLPTSDTLGTFVWKRFAIAGIFNNTATGSNNPQEVLFNTTILPVSVTYAFTSSNNFGCSNTQVVTVIVNPSTNLSSPLNPSPVCSNANFSYLPTSYTFGTSFTWTRPAVPGISNPPSGGTNNPNETLINTTNQPIPVNYLYNLATGNGCINNQVVTVQVLPTPVITSVLNPPAICSGSLFSYNVQSNVAGTVFQWQRPATPPFNNGPASGITNISETLINSTTLPANAIYYYTLMANSCISTQSVTVQVNPSPTIQGPQLDSICSGMAFSINPPNVPAGTQYTWVLSSNNPAGSLIGDSSQSTPQNSISQLLSNTSINSGIANYVVTPATSLCIGNPFNLTVTVKPTPAVTDTIFPALCSGSSFNYVAASGIPANTTYTWNLPLQIPFNSINGGSAQPISQTSVSQTLYSNLLITDTAIFEVTPSANGCAGRAFKITIPLKPSPAINNIIDTVCSGSNFLITPPSVPVGTTYTWQAPESNPFGTIFGGKAQVTPVTAISQNLSNTSNAAAQEVYTINPVFNTCQGNTFTLTLSVVATLPTFDNQSFQVCSGTPFNATPVTAPDGITYAWNLPTSMFGTVSGQTAAILPQNSISQILFSNGLMTDTITYKIIPNNLICKGAPFLIKVTVLPSPNAVITGKPIVCQYPLDTLSVSFSGKAPWSFSYSDTSGLHTVSGIISPVYNWIIAGLPNASSMDFSIFHVKDFTCLNLPDTFSFVQKLNPLPSNNTILDVNAATSCSNNIDTLLVNNFTSSPLTYQWTMNGKPINGATSNTLITKQKGIYNVILTNQFGCIDTTASPVTLNFYNLLSLPDIHFTIDSYCIDNPVHFENISNIADKGAIQWLWDLGDSTTSTAFNTTTIYYQSGTRHIKLSATQLNCKINTITLDSTITIDHPISNAVLTPVSAYIGEPIHLNARTFPGYTYLWQPSWGIDNPTSSTVNFTFTTNQQYLIKMTAPSGCITTDTLLVRVFDDNLIDILVPKSFTPNGDGINDLLYPYLSGIKEFHYFKVFNRFGNLVFSSDNANNGWNGMSNGLPQTLGVYIWAAEGVDFNGNLIQRKGQTLLLR